MNVVIRLANGSIGPCYGPFDNKELAIAWAKNQSWSYAVFTVHSLGNDPFWRTEHQDDLTMEKSL